MKPAYKTVCRHVLAVTGALTSSAELYNIFETLLRCGWALEEHQAKQFSLWLCIGLGVGFQFPADYKMILKNGFFKPPKPALTAPTLPVSKPRRVAMAVEIGVDLLASVIAGGLTFYSVFGLLRLFKHPEVPSWARYFLSSFFALPSAVTTFGVNFSNRFVKPISSMPEENQYVKYIMLSVGLPALVAAIGRFFEILYGGQSSLMGLLIKNGFGKVECPGPLFLFETTGQQIAFIVIGVLSLVIAAKAAVIEGLHIKKAYAKAGGLHGWLRQTFQQIILGVGNLVSSFVHTLPALAALSTLPVEGTVKIILMSLGFVLFGMPGMFVAGKYWQQAAASLGGKLSGAIRVIKKSSCTPVAREERERLVVGP